MNAQPARVPQNAAAAMSDVTLTIGGRQYKLACAAGEEAHIAMLGREIDRRLSALPALSRQSEAQTLLYATLLLADELHGLAAAREEAEARPDEAAELAAPLERLAEKLEALASRLEDRGGSA